jgi:hypothetical protein
MFQSDAVASKTTGAVFFGVTTADGPIYLHTAGTKLPDDPKSGVIDEDTVFWLCSQTKLITTVGPIRNFGVLFGISNGTGI